MTDAPAVPATFPAGTLFQVNRVLKFADGGAVSLPIKQFSDQNEAVRVKDAMFAAFKDRSQEPQILSVLSEIGVVGFEYRILPIQAPDSKIVIPSPRLVVPR